MDQELLNIIKAQSEKLESIQRSVDKMRKYFMWTLIITVVLFFLPLIGLLFVIPQFLSTYSSIGSF